MSNIPKLDLDLDGPLVKLFVFVDTHLTCAADLLKVVAESIVDLPHEFVQAWLPLAAQCGNLLCQISQPCLLNIVVGLLFLNAPCPVLVFLERLRVVCLDYFEFRALCADLL